MSPRRIPAGPRSLQALISLVVVLAVSVEPRGGSRTGAPTGPVVLTGTLAGA